VKTAGDTTEPEVGMTI